LPKSILIADDSDIVRSVIRAFLERTGYTVCGEAEDGLEAIEKATKLKPDLVVLDLSMPKLNGAEAASVLKSVMPRVPIILFTMYEEFMSQSLASAVGAEMVVSKPDGIGKLVECIQKLFGSRPHEPVVPESLKAKPTTATDQN
jgi:DNA-binding NarL/FixJ family response regulator